MIAALRARVSSAGNTHELALSGLDQGTPEALGRQLDLADRLTIDLDAALLDDAPPVAVRLPELVAQELRQVDDAAVDGRDRNLGLVGNPALADHARERALAALGALLTVCAARDAEPRHA